MKLFPFTTLTLLLALAGCALTPSSTDRAAEPSTAASPTPAGVWFSVSGEPKGAEECFVRHAIGYPEDIRPVELLLELETEMKRDDGSWLGVAWIEGIREQVPSPDAVGKTGGGLMHYVETTDLLLACDQVRFRMIVHGCEPGPCPPVSVDARTSSIELLIDDRSPR